MVVYQYCITGSCVSVSLSIYICHYGYVTRVKCLQCTVHVPIALLQWPKWETRAVEQQKYVQHVCLPVCSLGINTARITCLIPRRSTCASNNFYNHVFSPLRSVLEPLAQWDSPMQVKLSCWKSGLNTLLVELLPWALLANHSQWDLWLFEGETIVLQIAAGKVIVPPNFEVECQQYSGYVCCKRQIIKRTVKIDAAGAKISQTPKMLDPMFPIMQLNSICP